MRQILSNRLWIGHAGDLREPGRFERTGIRALVHVALEERLPTLSRELLYCHFPIVDGAGNASELIDVAVRTTAELIRARIPTLVACSAGMSRSPCIAAGAVALAEGTQPTEALSRVAADQPHDISPGLWRAVSEAVERLRCDRSSA